MWFLSSNIKQIAHGLNRKSRYFTACILVGIVVSPAGTLLAGCGSGTSAPKTQSAGMKSTIKISIAWPKSVSRSIPADTNRIVVQIIAPNSQDSKAVLIEKPATGGTVEYTIDGVWPGENRLITAEAKKVNAPGTGINNSPSNAQLSEGTSLSSGTVGPITLLPLVTTPIAITLTDTIPPISNDIYKLSGAVTPDPIDSSVINVSLNALLDPVNGKPLTGLTASNFTVYEDGVFRSIIDAKSSGSTTTATKTDIAFIMDTTGSMDPEIGGVRDSVISFANHLTASGYDVQLGGVSFGDEIRDTFQFTNKGSDFVKWVSGLSSYGGGDIPENDVDAIMTAVNNLHWRSGALKVLVIITDAPTHYLNDGDGIAKYSIAQVITALQKGNFVLDSVSTMGTRAASASSKQPIIFSTRASSGGYPDIDTVANATGGIAALLPTNGSVDLSALNIEKTILAGYIVRFRSIHTNTDHAIRMVISLSGSPVADKDFTGHY